MASASTKEKGESQLCRNNQTFAPLLNVTSCLPSRLRLLASGNSPSSESGGGGKYFSSARIIGPYVYSLSASPSSKCKVLQRERIASQAARLPKHVDNSELIKEVGAVKVSKANKSDKREPICINRYYFNTN
eukprot:3205866-Amphidinium_carterae.1